MSVSIIFTLGEGCPQFSKWIWIDDAQKSTVDPAKDQELDGWRISESFSQYSERFKVIYEKLSVKVLHQHPRRAADG
jgi:hypothetical protein